VNPLVVVSIVTGGSGQLLRDCVTSLFRTTTIPLEVVVVDNCAEFDTAAILQGLPPVRLVPNTRRLGFAANHNQVLKEARAPYVFVLNDDTVLFPGCLDRLVEALEHDPSLGMAGPRIWDDLDRSRPQNSAGDRFLGPGRALLQDLVQLTPLVGCAGWRRLIFGQFRPVERTERVAHLGGAAFMVRTDAMREVGLMDEQFGMYYEETDWCRRFGRNGWGILVVGDAELVHLGGQSTRPRAAWWAQVQRRSRDLYLRKHHPWGARFFLDTMRPPLTWILNRWRRKSTAEAHV